MQPLVSIIMPIFKAEKYVAKAITSLINQTYSNLEIILVNDCSPDNSLSICHQFAEQDSRIVIVDKQINEGEDLARFSGIEIAKGEWVTFVDADDWCDNTAVETLYNTANINKCNIVYGSLTRHFGIFYQCKINYPHSVLNHIIQDEEKQRLLSSYFGINMIPVTMWGGLFERKLFHPLPSKSKLKLGADLALSLQLYLRATKIYVTSENVYLTDGEV